MNGSGRLRGYGLGLIALVVALSTTGYFWAGQILSRPQERRIPPMPSAVVSIPSPKGTVELPVYMRANPRALDLLARKSHQGMLYSFSEPRDHDWTGLGLEKPVSAAFLDSRGTILAILDIEPCPTPPPGKGCRSYAPGVVYRQVLEVGRGWFALNQVGPGVTVRVRTLEATPNGQ
jgi:uncharacterized membrane protein (UPF0127 family)|uniref:DUF192 domain-containing protein n=1 Tax=Meiothermus ruber TaxID=277 RepID=A0A7C3DP77_MEIRU